MPSHELAEELDPSNSDHDADGEHVDVIPTSPTPNENDGRVSETSQQNPLDDPPPPYVEFESPRNSNENLDDDAVSGDDIPVDNIIIEEDSVSNEETFDAQQRNETIYEDDFPVEVLYKLDEMINRPRWVIPVLPGGELETLLKASIRLAKQGLDEKNAECMRFYREGLYHSTMKILTDEAVQNWKADIQRAIRNNCEKLIELIVLKLSSDNLALLDMLATLFNHNCRFHHFNANKVAEYEPSYQTTEIPKIMKYAMSLDNRIPKGWLVDLINRFGYLKGFDILLSRFQQVTTLSVSLLAALLRPFSGCQEFLTAACISTYFVPIMSITKNYLLNLSDAELKKESKSELKNDQISCILTTMKRIARQCSEKDGKFDVSDLRLEMILRLLRVSSFNGKMNALIEINKILQSSSNFDTLSCADAIPPDKLAAWLSENDVLSIVLRDNLHQPQYVDKLEKIIRFAIKEKALSLKDLDATWNAQVGKHEAIVKNVHELLAKLAWDFTPEQLDHLFTRFKESWNNANKKQREKLLALIRRLAEDDKEGEMAQKVLSLLWTLARSENCPAEIVDLALSAHIKILDCSVAQNREEQKIAWIETFIDQLRKPNDDWVVLALRMIRSICRQFPENLSQQMTIQPRMGALHLIYRDKLIHNIQEKYALVTLVANSLTDYMQKMKLYSKENPEYNPNCVKEGSRYTHLQQVEERLDFLCFVLKDGQLWLCLAQAEDIWDSLTEKSVYREDRQCCFRWFSKLMSDEPDLDPEISENFFACKILTLDTSLLSDEGIVCFDHFFKLVNCRANKFKQTSRSKSGFFLLDTELIGLNYLWKIIVNCSDELASKAIHLLIEIFTNLSVQLKSQAIKIYNQFIEKCMSYLNESFSKVCKISVSDKDFLNLVTEENNRMQRVLTVLKEFIRKTDSAFLSERKCSPLIEACCGKYLVLIVRIVNTSRQIDDFSIATHTHATVAHLRKLILQKFNFTTSNAICEIGFNNAMIDSCFDTLTLKEYKLAHKSLILAKVMSCSPGVSMGAAPALPSSDEEDDLDQPAYTRGGQNQALHSSGAGPVDTSDAECLLPSSIFSQQNEHLCTLLRICDWAAQHHLTALWNTIRHLISLLPCDSHVADRVKAVCADHATGEEVSLMPTVESLFFSNSPNQVLYYLEVLHVLLFPAVDPLGEESRLFQMHFIKARGVDVILAMLTKNNFLSNADIYTKRSAYTVVVKMSKLLYCSIGFAILLHLKNSPDALTSTASATFSDADGAKSSAAAAAQIKFEGLEVGMRSIPNCLDNIILRQVASVLACHMYSKYSLSETEQIIPDESTIKSLFKLACSPTGSVTFDSSHHFSSLGGSVSGCVPHSEENSGLPANKVNALKEPSHEDIMLSSEALEVLTICFTLNPSQLETFLQKEQQWNFLVQEILIKCPDRSLRVTCLDQLLLIATRANVASLPRVVNFFVSILLKQMTYAANNADRSDSFFRLVCKLLEYARFLNISIENLSQYLSQEITFIDETRNNWLSAVGVEKEMTLPHDFFLCGRLNLCRELVSFTNDEVDKIVPGCSSLIQELFFDFLFPATKALHQNEKTLSTSAQSQPLFDKCRNIKPICDQLLTQNAAFQLIIALSERSFDNFRFLVQILMDSFYSRNVTTITEWEFQPPIGCKAPGGFVGLKNAGATCYMNSVIQQLFMVPEIREGILSIPGIADEYRENDSAIDFSSSSVAGSRANDSSSSGFSSAARSLEHDVENLSLSAVSISSQLAISSNSQDARVQYHIEVLKYLQVIFGYLTASQLQYYSPEGFWKHFRFAGEPVNLREQQDALEFLNSIVDRDVKIAMNIVDEATKHLGISPSVFSAMIGGSFADQKICKDCPHRYSREEPFTTVSVDIRNNQTLKDSFEQYVKGDLLEGDNAYLCEKCGKKVDTVKRMCIKKLPPVLIIQLKRFDYDWERDCAIKFNDYFEFPFHFDIEPYTVDGLAKIEGEIIRDDSFETPPQLSPTCSGLAVSEEMSSGLGSKESLSIPTATTPDSEFPPDVSSAPQLGSTYKLMGVVVHSGQASGGHYNSYIQCRERDPLANKGQSGKWFKFDDGDVSELHIDDEAAELRNQWFGGDNVAEQLNSSFTSFDQKRNSSRRQKRWWNAYLLVYERRQELSDQTSPVQLCNMQASALATAHRPHSQDHHLKLVDVTSDESSLTSFDSEETTSAKGCSDNNKTCVPNSSTSSKSSLHLSITSSSQNNNNNSSNNCLLKMPPSISKAVEQQTVNFAHNKVQFMPEYLNFVKNLVSSCQATPHARMRINQGFMMDIREVNNQGQTVADQFGMLSMQLLCNVVFNTVLHTKKVLRGPAHDWTDLMITLLKHVACTRTWLAENWIFKYKKLISEYILDCPSAEVRQAIVKLLVFLCHFSNFDGPYLTIQQRESGKILATHASLKLSDYIVSEMASLMRKDVKESSKHLNQYFHFFLHYCSFGPDQRCQLLKRDVPLLMVNLVFEESNNQIKYQTSEFAKLYQVVSILVRCCDLMPYCEPSSGKEIHQMMANRYGDRDLEIPVPISVGLKERLLDETVYVKRIIEECPNTEETCFLICYLSWENASFSAAVLTDILWQITFAYAADLKPYLDLLLEVLKIPDSWQTHRIIKALKGTPKKQDSKDGLFETIEKSKTHFARRAYLAIKMLTKLFSQSPPALSILRRDPEIKNQWLVVVDWLKLELNRNQFAISSGGGNQYQNYNYSWNNSGAANGGIGGVSNETANGHALERSPSARLTLQKASEFIPIAKPASPSPGIAEKSSATTAASVSPASSSRIQEKAPPVSTSSPTASSSTMGNRHSTPEAVTSSNDSIEQPVIISNNNQSIGSDVYSAADRGLEKPVMDRSSASDKESGTY